MPKSVADYIREARTEYGLSQRALTQRLGGYAIAPIEAGDYLPSDKAAEKIAQVLALPESFFETLRMARSRHTRWGERSGLPAQKRTLLLLGDLDLAGVLLPVNDSGLPTAYEPENLSVDWIFSDERAFAVRVRGDGMRPQFNDGDIAVVSAARAYLAGDTVILRTQKGKCFLGVIHFDRSAVELRLLTPPDAKPMKFAKSEVSWIYKVVMHLLA